MKKSLTFLEILISTMLIATALAGLIATFVSSRRLVEVSQRRLSGINVIRREFARLSDEVREDTWNSGPLTNGCFTSLNVTPAYTEFSINYTSSNVPDPGNGNGQPDCRSVSMNVSYVTY